MSTTFRKLTDAQLATIRQAVNVKRMSSLTEGCRIAGIPLSGTRESLWADLSAWIVAYDRWVADQTYTPDPVPFDTTTPVEVTKAPSPLWYAAEGVEVERAISKPGKASRASGGPAKGIPATKTETELLAEQYPGSIGERKPRAPRKPPLLKANEIRALQVLAKRPYPLTRNQLKAFTGIKKGWSKMLGASGKADGGVGGQAGTALQARGLIRVTPPDPSMKERGFRYTITKKGRELLARALAEKEAREAEDRAASGLS